MSHSAILWLDASAADPTHSFCSKLNEAQTFTNVDHCMQYIRSHSHQLIYLIASAALGRQIVPQLHGLTNVAQVFLLGSADSAWSQDLPDKVLAFESEDDLLARLWTDLEVQSRKQAARCFEQADEFKRKALILKQSCCG